MVRKVTLTKGQPLTAEQIAEIDEAVKRPIVYDEDSPALTDETYAAFKKAAAQRDAQKNKRIV